VKQAFKILIKAIAKFLAIFFAVATLALVIISFTRPEWIKSGIEWIGGLIRTLGNWNYLIAFLSACIESLPIIGTAIPGMNVMILVGGFWAKYHIIPTVALAALGAMLGNYLGYWIGKWYGRELIERYGDWFGMGKTEAGILH
jgi:membrane protein DedA with SNARE-associated domain